MAKYPEMRLDILIKKEKDHYSAHCLQFDLVATDDTKEGVRKAIIDICNAHIEFSQKNENMDYLFSPAPKEVWAEYYALLKEASSSVDFEEMIPPFMIQEVLYDGQAAC